MSHYFLSPRRMSINNRGCRAEAVRSHGGSTIRLHCGSVTARKWTPIRVRFAGPFRKPRYLRGRSAAESFCCVGVFADELKPVSVMEGDYVTLKINVTEIQKGEKILWTFGTNGPLIAKTSGVNNTILDVSDERFRDRLKLDEKTGSLTIMNIRTEDAGVYEVEISRSRSETKHRFNVTVYETHRHSPVLGQQTLHASAEPPLGHRFPPERVPVSRGLIQFHQILWVQSQLGTTVRQALIQHSQLPPGLCQAPKTDLMDQSR
ncbi:unnamed protein product [Leuciscus chuanchicus]